LLKLRPLTPGDCEQLASWIGSEDALYQWSGPADFSWPLDAGQLRRDLSARRRGALLLAAVDSTGAMAGHVKLQVVSRHRLGLIGRVLIAPGEQGHGYGGALMREVVRHGFDDLGLHRLQLTVYAFNTPAIAVYRRAGFTVEGRLPDAAVGSDGFWTALIMGMLETDPRPAAGGDPFPSSAAVGDGKAWAVRPAGAGDRAPVTRLLAELGYPQDEAEVGAQLAAWSADPASAVLVAARGGVLGGLIAVARVPYFERPGAFGRILALHVGADHRRQGLGRLLVDAAETWAARRGCVDVEVTSSRSRDAAHRFYPALGYEDHCAGSARYKRRLAEDRAAEPG
jgi:RimJ/RimL family protein N-acetyltransferase